MKRIFVCFIILVSIYSSCCSADMMYRHKERPWYIDMLYHIKVKGGYVLTDPEDNYNVSTSIGLGREKRLHMSAGTSGSKIKYIWRFK